MAKKNRYHRAKWCWKINSVSQVTTTTKRQKRDFSWFYATRLPQKLQLESISSRLSQPNWGKRGTTENPISLSQSQFQLSRDAPPNSLLIRRATRETPAFGFSACANQTFSFWMNPHETFSPTSQPEIRKLFATYPGGLITVSHDRRFLKEVCTSIYRLTEHGLEVVNLEDL